MQKHFTAKIDKASSVKILIASATAAAITYAITSPLKTLNWIKLMLGAATFLTTYTTTAPLIGAINKTDIKNLKEMLKELKSISHLFNPLLNMTEKLTLTFSKT